MSRLDDTHDRLKAAWAQAPQKLFEDDYAAFASWAVEWVTPILTERYNTLYAAYKERGVDKRSYHARAMAAENEVAALTAENAAATNALKAAIPALESFEDFWEEPGDNDDIKAALRLCRAAVGLSIKETLAGDGSR